MKKVLLTLTLMSTLSCSFISFSSAPAASKESAESPFLSYLAYRCVDAAVLGTALGATGLILMKAYASEFADASKKTAIEPFAATESETELDHLIGEKPEEFNQLIDMIDNPTKYKRLKVAFPKAFLMDGPPGTGKTELARGFANKLGVSYFEICGSQLEGKYYGESVKKVNALFDSARKAAPAQNSQNIHAVIFIDELETIAPRRSGYSVSQHHKQTLGALLTEMTKKNENKNILIIGATNYKEMIDEALLRPGRFDIHVPIRLPNETTRAQILSHYAKNYALDGTVNEEALAKMDPALLKKGYLTKYPHLFKPAVSFMLLAGKTSGFSGAELEELCVKAGRTAIKDQSDVVRQKDFDGALNLMLTIKKEAAEKAAAF